MGAPPAEKATAGRINPAGVPYLYWSAEVETCIAEIRPWRQAWASVAKFETVRETRIVNLVDPPEANTMVSNLPLLAVRLRHPAHTDDERAYVATQQISEHIRRNDFDGIEYSSSLAPHGRNVALFHESVVRGVETATLLTCYTQPDVATMYEVVAQPATLLERISR
jgi:hypothetical protein